MATYTKDKDVETNLEDDPRTREELRKVFANTARWPAGFKGFSADITVNVDGKEEQGSVTVRNPKEIDVSLQDEKLKGFASENLASIAMHRGPRSFEESDGKYKLQFGDEPGHPLGQRIILGGDGMSSFYRIKDGRIRQINRKTPRISFTINIEDSVKTQDGKYLTSRYTVYYFNPENGVLKDVESYSDAYTRVGDADLPELRRIINSDNGGVSVSTMTLSNHKTL
ncbi:MAG: DUF3386 family protein [Nitrospinales bacterium]